MTWLNTLRTVASGLLLSAMLFVPSAQAQQNTGRDAVKAAYEAFNAALSARDLEKMEAIWVHEPDVVSANPRDKKINKGWDAVKANWATTFAFWSELKVTRRGEPQIGIAQPIAWSITTADVQGQRRMARPSASR